MKKTKKLLTRGLVGTIAMFGCVLGAKVTLQPLYSDVRFEPSDKLHAGCSNSADILFSPQAQKITNFTIVLYYNPESLEILRVLPAVNDGTITSKIEYNKIILEVKNPTFSSTTDSKSFFKLYFKSDVVGKETLVVGTGSEAVTTNKVYPLDGTFALNFEQVPECEPDIIPPSINLIYPKDTQKKITLDQYFIFDIKDIGKGVDKSSVIVNFNGDQYFYGSENLKWNGNYMTFYPGTWIPINKSMELKILVTDQQSYGGANTTESTYNFKSATGMLLNKNITPTIFRQIAQQAEKISASVDECQLLADFYHKTEVNYQVELKSIIQKVGCDLATLDTSLLGSGENNQSETNDSQRKYRNISVFASLGWILFLMAFALKMHYLVSYKKHKTLHEKLKNSK